MVNEKLTRVKVVDCGVRGFLWQVLQFISCYDSCSILGLTRRVIGKLASQLLFLRFRYCSLFLRCTVQFYQNSIIEELCPRDPIDLTLQLRAVPSGTC